MRVILVTALPNSQGWLVKEEGNEWLHHWTGQGSFTALSSNGGGGLHAGQFIELPEYDAEAQLKAFNDSELTALLQGERETKIQVTFDLTLGHRLTDDDFDIWQILDQAQSAIEMIPNQGTCDVQMGWEIKEMTYYNVAKDGEQQYA